jgi:hypothetical protein
MTPEEPSIDQTDNPDPAVQALIRTLLSAHGLDPTEDEVAVLVGQYASRRQGIELLHAMPQARYESPALVFIANPMFSEWAEES